MLKFYSFLWFLLGFLIYHTSVAATIHIVAAENFYGAVAKEIGGSDVHVDSIMSQPDQDPHLFTISPSIPKNLAQANLVVLNGLGYDPWMQGLLSVSRTPERTVICVGELVGKKEGDNPHIWYDPATMPVYARAIRDYLIEKEPKHKASYEANYEQFLKENEQITWLINQLKPHSKGLRVIATEPVFGYMAQALGFIMEGRAFQMSMMNGVDPSPRQVLNFQNELQIGDVKILFYNKQVNSPLTQQLRQLAAAKSILVVGVTETQPINKTYTVWMVDQLKEIKVGIKKIIAKQKINDNRSQVNNVK